MNRMIHCKNCAAEYEGKYCPNCGQKAKTARITTIQVFNEVRDQFIKVDKGFLYTVRELSIRPGHSIREYLEGKRVRHIKPVKFMIWAGAFNLFISHLLGFQERLMERLKLEKATSGAETQHSVQKAVDFISAHPNVMMLLTIPTIAFCSWLFFRRQGYNYAEYFSMNAFLMGQLSIVGIATNLGLAFWRDLNIQHLVLMGSLQWLVWMLYYGWAYSQFFKQRRVLTWFKGILVLFAGYVLLVFLFIGTASLAMEFFKPQLDAWLNN